MANYQLIWIIKIWVGTLIPSLVSGNTKPSSIKPIVQYQVLKDQAKQSVALKGNLKQNKKNAGE